MYSIIIQGKKESGKSTTIGEVCRLLKPTKVSVIRKEPSVTEEVPIDQIYNETYILEVKGKNILVMAGAPTEQKVTIAEMIEICNEMNISIDFIICAMRTKERKPSSPTVHEIKKMSTLLQIFKIQRIDGDDYRESIEWKDRIADILKTINDNL